MSHKPTPTGATAPPQCRPVRTKKTSSYACCVADEVQGVALGPMYIVYYHTACTVYFGRAWAPIAMLKYAGKIVDVRTPDRCPMGSEAALPVVTCPGGRNLAETSLIVPYVGEQCGLGPNSDNNDEAKRLVAEHEDLFSDVMEAETPDRLNSWLEYLEHQLKGPCFLGMEVTYVDFAFFFVIETIRLMSESGKLLGIEVPEKINRWYVDTMCAIPAIIEMLDSGVPMLPKHMVVPAAMPSPTSTTYVITYPADCDGFFGRLWAPVAMLRHAGLTYELKSSDAAQTSELPSPSITFPGGYTIAQDIALTIRLGKQCGLAPGAVSVDAKAGLLLTELASSLDDVIQEQLAMVNARLSLMDSHFQGPFFMGKYVTYVDFALFMVLEAIQSKHDNSRLGGVQVPARLLKWHLATMPSIPAVKAMLDSGKPLIPKHLVAPTPAYTVYYHTACRGFFGRAWAPVAMLKHAGKRFRVRISEEAPAGNGFAPPFVKFPKGYTISQTNAIITNLGAQCSLAPDAGYLDAKARQLVADVGDCFSELCRGEPAERLSKWLLHLSSHFEGPHVLGERLTYVDFALYPVLELVAMKQRAGKLQDLEVPACLVEWHLHTMPGVPAVRHMIDSGVPLLPSNMV